MSLQFKIFKLNNRDLSLLHSFKSKEWPEADQDHYGDLQPDFSRYKDTLIAKKENEILGYLTYSIEQGVALIESIIVDKKFRKKGIAKQLMKEAELKIKVKGAHKIYLETGVDWDARFLYESLEYQVRCLLPNHYGNRDFIIMDKLI